MKLLLCCSVEQTSFQPVLFQPTANSAGLRSPSFGVPHCERRQESLTANDRESLPRRMAPAALQSVAVEFAEDPLMQSGQAHAATPERVPHQIVETTEESNRRRENMRQRPVRMDGAD
jgi:hypothetical protein